VQKSDIIVVHDDLLLVTWRLAIVEDLIAGSDGLVQASTIYTANRTPSSTKLDSMKKGYKIQEMRVIKKLRDKLRRHIHQ